MSATITLTVYQHVHPGMGRQAASRFAALGPQGPTWKRPGSLTCRGSGAMLCPRGDTIHTRTPAAALSRCMSSCGIDVRSCSPRLRAGTEVERAGSCCSRPRECRASRSPRLSAAPSRRWSPGAAATPTAVCQSCRTCPGPATGSNNRSRTGSRMPDGTSGSRGPQRTEREHVRERGFRACPHRSATPNAVTPPIGGRSRGRGTSVTTATSRPALLASIFRDLERMTSMGPWHRAVAAGRA